MHPTLDDRRIRTRRARWPIAALVLVLALALWGGLLAAGYNLVNHLVRHVERRPFPPEMREAIYAVMPWSLAAFAATLLLLLIAGRRRRVALLATGLAAQALVCAPFGTAAFATVGLAAVGLATIGTVAVAATAGLRHWRRAVSRYAHAAHAAGGASAAAPLARNARPTALLALVFVASALTSALLVRQIHRQWHNSLHDNGRWSATKMEAEKALIGAVSFYVSRKPLAGGQLNLGAWHGMQEVVLRQPLQPANVAFDATVPDDGYVILRLGAAGAGEFSGIRLSRDARFPSAWFRASADGQFLELRPLDVVLPGGRRRVALDCASGTVSLDGAVVAAVPPPPAGPLQIGFRAGSHGALVDDVAVAQLDGSVVRESWDSPCPGWSAFALALTAFVGLGALLGVASRRRRPDRPFWFVPAAVGVPATVLVGVLTLADALVLARANPLWLDYRGYATRIETEAEVVARARDELAVPPGCRRLVALGSSQTWGAGAARAAHTWVRQLEQLLNEGAPAPRWHCFNGGISGAVAAQIFAAYRREWAAPPADLAIVNLSHNDPDPEVLRRELEQLLAFHRQRGTTTVLLLEPNAIDSVSRNVLPNHAVVREVGAATGTPVIDMMALLAAEHDSGLLWWDTVHLTSYGQRRFAELLHQELVAKGLVRA